MKAEPDTSRWKGAVTGVIGGLVGLAAMRYYWQNVAPRVQEESKQLSEGSENTSVQSTEVYPEELNLDSIALFGKQYQEQESATAAIGRMLYTQITGSEPQSQQTKTLLSYLIHWGYGLFQGAVYGVTRSNAAFPDLGGGLKYGVKLWLGGDELMVPLLGFQSGPTAISPIQHVNRLGAHLFYGTSTAVATQLLRKLL